MAIIVVVAPISLLFFLLLLLSLAVVMMILSLYISLIAFQALTNESFFLHYDHRIMPMDTHYQFTDSLVVCSSLLWF